MPQLLPRLPSHGLDLVQGLSVEEKYSIAETARRKSGAEASRHALRLAVGHTHTLDMLLKDIAKEEYTQALKIPPPNAPTKRSDMHINWADKTTQHDKEHAFEHVEEDIEEDIEELNDAEDLESLSLSRTLTRGR
jgi:hypothetical protein